MIRRFAVGAAVVVGFGGFASCEDPPPPPPTTTPASSTTAAPSPTTTTTTTAAPTTTVAPSSGTFLEDFATGIDGWTFASNFVSSSADGDSGAEATTPGGHLSIRNGRQNYGDATLRSATKYDLSVGGTVSLDIADDGQGNPLIGSAYVMFSAGPQDAKLQHADDRPDPYGPVPTEGTVVWLRDNCRVPWAPPIVVTYPAVDYQRGSCAAAPDGKLRLVYTPGHLSVRNGAGAEIVAYDVALPPVGYVTLGVHNHASLKYSVDHSQASVTGTFDNVSYPTSGGAPSPTTTSTVAPSTSGAPTTTATTSSTTAPTTTAPPTTTSAPTTTTTTQPPAGVQFSETFETDQRARFDWRLQTTNEPPSGDFIGEHDMGCGPPTTFRTVHQPFLTSGIAHTNVNVTDSELVWWCAPGGDVAKGHMMTGLNTGSIATLSFTPKQTLTNVHKVCWDQNMNNLGEGKWLNVFVVPAAAYSGDPAYAAHSGLGFGGIPQMPPTGSVDFTWLRGSIEANKWTNGSPTQTMAVWKSGSQPGYIGMATESASRFTICLDDQANTVTIERPFDGIDSDTEVYPLGTTFPTGPVKVIFQDASYNPDKHNGDAQHVTWHWDNIQIS